HSESPASFRFPGATRTQPTTLSLHDALPICFFRALVRARDRDAGQRLPGRLRGGGQVRAIAAVRAGVVGAARGSRQRHDPGRYQDRKSTRLNSSHVSISYAVFFLKKKETARP